VNGGLLFLLRRSPRGKMRQAWRRMKTVKGALAFGFGALFIGGFVALQLWTFTLDVPIEPASRATVLAYLPPALLLLSVLGAMSGRALYFSPAEVDFLFPAPVGRRELLLYNLVSRVGVQLASGVWVALFVARYAVNPWNAAAATALSFVFLYVAAQAMGVAAAAAEVYVPERARPYVRRGLIVGLLSAALAAVATAGSGATPGMRLRAVAAAAPVQALAYPLRPFAELFGAAGWADGALWAAACLGVIAAVAGLVLLSDVAYTERSLAVSAKMHARLARMRSGGGIHASAAPSRLRVRTPGLRVLGGAGALAWRQLTELARTPRALVVPLLGLTVWVGTILFAFHESGDPDPAASAAVVIGVCLMLPVLFSGHVAFDFRRDLDRMDVLRSLPLSPVQVAAGQVLPVALVFMVMQYLVVIAAVVAGALRGPWLLGLALVVPPYAWATLAVENGLFLLMPYRVTPGDDQRMQFMGKVMLSMFLKAIVTGVLALAAGAAGWGIFRLTDSLDAGIAVGCVVLALGCIPLTFMVGLAFLGFDIGRDTPA